MSVSGVATYRVEAFNMSWASENRIHDDATARRFGFHGGLVPGVEVYAYMAHMPVAGFGRTWLERGGMECRFLKPVYDGKTATISAEEGPDGFKLSVESEGALCASGRSWVADAPLDRPSLDAQAPAAPPAVRPPASLDSLATGRALGIAPAVIDAETLRRYIADVRETDEIYRREGLVHPGQILRLANAALMQNVVLGPWIHVGSHVQNFAVARIGERLTLNSRITSNHEHKGHGMVELEALVAANGAVVAAIRHTAIWRPRQMADGG
ncbi:hypothetical protein SAMN05444161_3080 [Rhizobiales bacterium GAS191]|nr:hypothetical protein SAMN05519104_0271 [Rhizobiales bacterium GAS188]SED37994.1 hypothetical protein SAMN05444161_3080 [Rhizobiales bacterium GAS191]